MTKYDFQQFGELLKDFHEIQIISHRVLTRLKSLNIYNEYIADLYDSYQEEAEQIKNGKLPFLLWINKNTILISGWMRSITSHNRIKIKQILVYFKKC